MKIVCPILWWTNSGRIKFRSILIYLEKWYLNQLGILYYIDIRAPAHKISTKISKNKATTNDLMKRAIYSQFYAKVKPVKHYF